MRQPDLVLIHPPADFLRHFRPGGRLRVLAREAVRGA